MTPQTRIWLDQKLAFVKKNKNFISGIMQLFFAIWYLYGLIDKEWSKEGTASAKSPKKSKKKR
jgi:hypothetical protein